MIHRAKFQNFKALKDVGVTFDSRVTVLVGPNGSGKTSVLRGIFWLCQMAGDATFQQGVKAATEALPTTFSGDQAIQRIEISSGNGPDESGIKFRAHPTNVVVGASASGNAQHWECVTTSAKVGEKSRSPQVGVPGVKPPSFVPAELIQLRAGLLSAPSLTQTTPPVMKSDGSGLASLMSYFKNEDEAKYEQAVSLLRNVVSRIQGVRITRVQVGGGSALGEGLLFDLPGRKGVPASAMSDGTLYALGLIVKILDPQRPKTLLIDDIDHGFHPTAQLTLVELLHKLLDEIPDLQIIATSHSPYILSGLKWEEVRVTGLRDDGSAVIAPLTKHPNYEKWKESMSPGEFWSHAGEDWVLKVSDGEAIAR